MRTCCTNAWDSFIRIVYKMKIWEISLLTEDAAQSSDLEIATRLGMDVHIAHVNSIFSFSGSLAEYIIHNRRKRQASRNICTFGYININVALICIWKFKIVEENK